LDFAHDLNFIWISQTGILMRLRSPTMERDDFMNNSDLADALAADHGLTKADARKLGDGVFGAIADAAANGDEIALNGFGKFKVKATPAREGRNPSSGATIQIAASKKLTFAPAKAVKDKLNG
jgi:DNA-binding protein HU-beta